MPPTPPANPEPEPQPDDPFFELLAPASPAPDSFPDSFPDSSSDSFADSFQDDPELLLDFLNESAEHLAAIDQSILLLEQDPSLLDLLHAIFRGFHSIKGLAGFLELHQIQSIAHEVETLLDHARNLRIPITPAFVDLVLETSELLKQHLALLHSRLNATPPPHVPPSAPLLARLALANSAVDTSASPSSADQLAALDALLAASPQPEPTPNHNLEPEPETTALVPLNPHPVSPTVRQNSRAADASSIRVETAKLDRLMDTVGELVIAQSILANNLGRSPELTHLARITADLQRSAMAIRMTSIGPLFQKNAKMVRDLARRSGKLVALTLHGESTELDKIIAEELADPLLHMIRNAIDHGIEPPDDRVAAGKDPTASLRLAAEHRAGQIVISISDDGRGLDTDRIFKKAVHNGLIPPDASLTQDQIRHLIFAPGFSTAEKITDISGRGVGMDVVRQHVLALRGRIEIDSTLGRGATFSIHLPLTLAILEGLILLVGPHRYILPLFSVREILRPTPDMLFRVHGPHEVVLLRGSLLPIVRLHQRFSLEPRTRDLAAGLLVLCQFASTLFCLFVDELVARQHVVVKPLDEAFRSVAGITGSAILGDGRVGLILDAAGIFRPAPLSPDLIPEEAIAAA